MAPQPVKRPPPPTARPPDEAGYLDEGTGVLVDEVVADAARWSDGPSADAESEIEMHHDPVRPVYAARIGDLEVADLRYAETDGRVVVLTTTVAPEFRGRGIATDLLADALDDLRTRVGLVSVTCPVVGPFMTANPQFADLLDPA